jgi:hypothetical protein
MLCVGATGPWIAGIALKHSLWLPYLLCVGGLALSFLVVYWMPETMHQTGAELSAAPEHAASPTSSQTYLRKFEMTLKTFGIILQDKHMLAGMTCVFLAHLRTVGVDVLLQYASYRFAWPLAKVRPLTTNLDSARLTCFKCQTTVLVTVIYCTNIAVCLLILPFSIFVLSRFTAVSSVRVDLLVARCSLALLFLGVLTIGVSKTVAQLFSGEIIGVLEGA